MVKVFFITGQVTASRKGLRNQLKTLLWRKTATQPGGAGGAGGSGRESPMSGSRHGSSSPGGGLAAAAAAATANGGAAGPAASVEAQMRALADLAFMMQVTGAVKPVVVSLPDNAYRQLYA